MNLVWPGIFQILGGFYLFQPTLGLQTMGHAPFQTEWLGKIYLLFANVM